MHIINTNKQLVKIKSQILSSKSQTNHNYQNHNIQNKTLFGYLVVRGWNLLLVWCLSIGILFGCVQKSDLQLAQDYEKRSVNYYQCAVAEYKKLITQNKDLDRLYLQLGRLYYAHGDFKEAIEALKKINAPQAKKITAISYYRLGNFTDALDIFNKEEILDDEYLYYRALTCERLNLFDQALANYKKIESKGFKRFALERANAIEKQVNTVHIKDTDPELYKILADAPNQKDYPQAGAFILSCNENIEITQEGTEVSSLHYVVKILNERGKENFSETHIEYDSTYEKVELEYARTIKPNGEIIDVGVRHIRDVSKYLNFPLYSNVRVYIISFPEIAEDAVIEYKLKIYRNQLINKKDFVLDYSLQTSEPVIAANFSVSLPKEKTLHIKILNDKYNSFGANLIADVKEEDKRLIYRWQFKDIPQIVPESNMPATSEINPTIILSTFKSWQEIYNWWWPLARDKIKSDTAIKEKVNELIKDQISKEDKARAIYNFCAQKIRYVAVEYGQAGYEPHSAGDIFKNKYGDCKDQAILLVTMLKEAGFSAWPVLIATREQHNLNEDFPSMLFNHCIAALSLDDKVIFLDPTAETCSFQDMPVDDQGRRVLVIKEDGYEIQQTPLYPASHNLVIQDLKIKLNSDEAISAERSVFALGMYSQAQRYWLLYTQPEVIEEGLKKKIQDISIGATLKNYNIENLYDLNKPVVLSYSFIGPEYLTAAGRLRIMPQLSGLDTSLVAKDKRRYAIDFRVLDTKENIFEIEIPSNFVIKYIPESINQDSPWLKLILEYKRKGNNLYFKQKIELKKNMIPDSEYTDFKEFFEKLAKQTKQRIVLERKR